MYIIISLLIILGCLFTIFSIVFNGLLFCLTKLGNLFQTYGLWCLRDFWASKNMRLFNNVLISKACIVRKFWGKNFFLIMLTHKYCCLQFIDVINFERTFNLLINGLVCSRKDECAWIISHHWLIQDSPKGEGGGENSVGFFAWWLKKEGQQHNKKGRRWFLVWDI